MLQIQFTNGATLQENSESANFTFSAFVGDYKSINTIFEKNIQSTGIKPVDFHYNVKDRNTFIIDSSQYSIQFLEESKINTLSYLNSYELLQISNSISDSSEVVFNIRIIQKSLMDKIGIHSVTIEESKVKEESLDMHEKLLSHRNNIEKYGMFMGSLLGTATLMISLFFSVEFAAVAPATLLFFSLPVFVFMRKQLRGDNQW